MFQVLWYRDTLQLDMTEWRITDVRGNRYTLRLRKVQKTDFGNYSCVADNGLGKSKRFIEVTGKLLKYQNHNNLLTRNMSSMCLDSVPVQNGWVGGSTPPQKGFCQSADQHCSRQFGCN